jgi:hypothetical protein
MIKKIKLEEAVALTQQADSKCINTEVTQHGYCDTWIVNFLDEYYRFSMYISKYNSWHGVNPPYTELTKVKLVEKIVVTTEWAECE